LGSGRRSLGESLHCFRFIIVVSVPLALMLSCVAPRPTVAAASVALTAALGVAALAAFALQFFHHFDSTVTDSPCTVRRCFSFSPGRPGVC
jgi:hypothetical protein